MPYLVNGGGLGSDYVVNAITIESGQTTSDIIDLRAQGLCGFQMPAAFTGTSITFEGSPNGDTYTSLYNTANTEYSVTVAASRFYVVNPGDFVGVRFLRFVSGSAEGAQRVILSVARSLQ